VLNQNPQKNAMSVVQGWIGVALVIAWGFGNIVKTHIEEKLIAEVETRRVSASDFTLMVKNFPREQLGENKEQMLGKVQKIFSDYYEQQKLKRECAFPYEVVSVNVAKPLYLENVRTQAQRQKTREEINERQRVFRTWIRQRKFQSTFSKEYGERWEKYEEYNNFYSDSYEKGVTHKSELPSLNTVFVTLRYSKARESI
jgi:hypothetical protein